jgi:hypothetical protein
VQTQHIFLYRSYSKRSEKEKENPTDMKQKFSAILLAAVMAIAALPAVVVSQKK